MPCDETIQLIIMGKINNKKSKPKQKALPKTTYDLKCFSVQQLYDSAIKAYQQIDQTSADKWNRMMTESGTQKDKVSAAGLMILENPETSLRYFDMLVKWAFDNNQNFAFKACQALSNVYVEHVFIEKSSLNTFVQSVQQYIKTHKKNTKVESGVLIAFYLQNQMKQYYNELVKAFQLLLECDLTHIKKNCLKQLGGLAKFRQLRRTILSMIINKLGDTDMEVVNEVTKCLKKEFYDDVLSGETLFEEVERFLFRSKLPQKAQFYVINFLNCINLKLLSEKGMSQIFELFYHFFKKFIDTNEPNSDELSSRLFLNSIKGLNKIFSFMKTGNKQIKKNIEDKIQNIYKVIHKTPNLKARIQLLLFLFQTHSNLHHNLIDRFYRTLYEFLKENQIVHCSLAEMFFDLVLISIKQDQNINRMMAMCKRLLQLCFHANSNFIITTLLMLDKIIQSNEGFKTLLFQAENFMAEEQKIEKYDIFKREPKFANAQKTCLWQLRAFSSHYHPTVRKFVGNILRKEGIQFQGANPLLQFNITSFVQKFALKKQKKSDSWKLKVRRNLQKIRTSKYQTLVNKPLEAFGEDQQFIKKYLDKRSQIHVNRTKMRTTDIQEFADQVIQQEMDRLNPEDAQLDSADMSQLSEEDEFGEGQFDEQGDDGQFDEQGDEGQFDEQEDDRQFDEEDLDGQLSGELDENEDFSNLSEIDEQKSEQKQFEDVFDEIEEEDSYPQKRKPIRKPKNKNNSQNKGRFKPQSKGKFKSQNKRKFNKK